MVHLRGVRGLNWVKFGQRSSRMAPLGKEPVRSQTMILARLWLDCWRAHSCMYSRCTPEKLKTDLKKDKGFPSFFLIQSNKSAQKRCIED